MPLPVLAFDVNDQLSISGLLAAAGQCQNVSALLPSDFYGRPLAADGNPMEEPFEGEPAGGYDLTMDAFSNECRGGMPFQLEISYHPNESNEFFVTFGFAAGNSLNEVSPWNLAPWAADLEDDVKDINGSNRSYLLAAWYKYTQKFQNESILGATIGIIDSTDYLDGNAYANDEYTQFMNESFVNAGNYNLPSYDVGVALEFAYGSWTFNGLGMNITENDEDYNYNFWGAEIAYHPETALGAGNYRLGIEGTSSAFLDPSGEKKDSLLSYDLSFDQEFGNIVGGFLRFTWQQEDAAVDYKALYSGGINFSGKGWNRDEDNIGVGYAYLEGGNQSVENTQVFEAYYRAVLNEYAAITADIQYMKDDITNVDSRQENPEGWIFGMRLTAEF